MSKPSNIPLVKAKTNIVTETHRDNSHNLFHFEGRKIAPVETSTFHTVDFRNPNSADAILYSTQLSACAVVIIKNKLNGQYDNVVTMAHFYPANAQEAGQTASNMSQVFQDYQAHGGAFNKDTSVILLGGGLLPGEDIMMTTPLGPLIDCLDGNQPHLGYKFNHHRSSVSDLQNLDDTLNGSMAFVDKTGTSILSTTFNKRDNERSFTPLTKEKESMPLDLLSRIGSCNSSYYPDFVESHLEQRSNVISRMMKGEDKPQMPLKSSRDVLSKAFNAQRQAEAER